MKRVLSILLVCALTLSLCACATSPTAVKVNGTAIDASEVAFYLHYNRDAGSMDAVRAAALEQITTAELIRQKCKALKLSLSKEQKETLQQEKDALIQQLGGSAAYLSYLQSSYLTDRAYDKLQENGMYYQLLYNYLLEEHADLYTSEYLRQFFAANYVAVQYIGISRVDDNGNPLSEEDDAAQKAKAEAALSAMLADNADYAAIMEEYNEDPEMMGLTEPLVLSHDMAETDYPFLLPVFNLAAGEFDGIYTTDSGYYILMRFAVSANYYSEHQEDIYYTAVDATFQQVLDDMRETSHVTTGKVFQKMQLDNLADYLK